ncbi:WD40-repeat-containing domain protein [Phlyctochytrium arcticum]|nr:WD40-repeat-containing domain protein [Phlyctochytrium arcticum]
MTQTTRRYSGAQPATEETGPKQISLTCSGHTRPVVDLGFSSFTYTGDFFLISACKDGIPILRRGNTGDWVGSLTGHKGAIWGARLTRDATISVTGSADFTAKIWDNLTGQVTLTLPHSHIVRCVDVTGEGRYVFTGGYEKKVRVFDLRAADAGTPLKVLEGCNNEIKTGLLDGDHGLVFAGDGKTLRVWDLRTSAQISTRDFDSEITSLRFSWDKKFIICTAGKNVTFFNSTSSQVEKSIDVNSNISSAALHPSGDKFVVGGTDDMRVRVYDYKSDQEKEMYKGHFGPIHCVSYSPDGHLYATGSEDGTVRLWQTEPGIRYGLWEKQ